MKASVVVPCSRNIDDIIQLILSLAFQYELPDEVILICDRKVEIEIESPFKLKIILFKGSPGGKRNLGVSAAKNKVIFFLDDDVVADPFFLYNGLKTVCDGIACGGKIIVSGRSYIAKFYNNQTQTWTQPFQSQGTIEYLIPANMAIMKADFLKAGKFSQQYLFSGEDMDFGKKLKETGIKAVFNPRMIVFHRNKENFFNFALTYFRYGKGNALFYKRYGYLPGRNLSIIRAIKGYFTHSKDFKFTLLNILRKVFYHTGFLKEYLLIK